MLPKRPTIDLHDRVWRQAGRAHMSGIWHSLKQRDGAKLPAEPGEPSASGRNERAERRRCFSQFGVAPEAACPASLLYHVHSRLSPEWECPLSDAEVSQLTLDLTAYKRYPAARKLALPRAFEARAPLEAVIRQRRTAHSFRRATMSLEALATLLQLSCGVTRDGRLPLRAAPSPGGLYAVESYPVAFDVASVAPGVY